MRNYAVAVVVLVLLLGLLALAGSVRAAGSTYTVNTTSFTNDGSCDPLDSGDCTVWEAVQLAAVNAGEDTIAFDIPVTDTNYGHNTAGVWSIVLTDTLPSLAGDIVDGTTQAQNVLSDTNPYGPEIELSGEGLSAGASCWFIGSDGTIKGLAINRCPAYGVVVSGAYNTIVGNYIGTDATGSSDVSTGYDGILLGNGTENNTIGGPAEADRNVISAMNGGIRIFQTTGNTAGNVVEGNYIGTDRTGTQPLGNGYGIKIHGGAHDNTIGPHNVIAFNTVNGVWVTELNTNGNTITENNIYGNGGLGIDLTFDGNDSVAAPSIPSHTCASASGTAPLNATVELFTGPDDEGKTFLTSVSADGSGNWSASGFLADDAYLTATATDSDGNTSEFSAAVTGCDKRTYVPLATKNY
jgi:hypothetical protein